MFAQLLSVAAFCVLGLAAFGLGRPILRGLGLAEEDRLSAAVWSVALGLIAAGMLLLGLGLLGWLYAPVIGALTLSAAFWGLGEILRVRRGSVGSEDTGPDDVASGPDDPPWGPPGRWLRAAVFSVAAAAALGSLLGALAPPTAGDALCYHLELPKAFLAEHRIVFLPYHDNSTFPLLTEMWYLCALALEGGVSAQLVHWGLGILLGLSAVVLATPIVGRPWAWVAGAVVLLAPGVNNQMTAPLNDVALAAMSTLALAAWWRGAIGGQRRRWFLLAGLAAGGALGIKYVALVLAAAMGLTWVWAMVRQAERRRLLVEGAVIMAVVAVSIGGPWYARAAWHRGNPVFPMLSEVFGQLPTAVSPHETLPESKSPLGRGPLGLAAAPWQVTLHPEQFGGRGHQLGVLLLAGVPGVLLCRRLRGLGILLGASLVYCVLWYLLRQNVRFLLPALPPLSVAVVWVWIETGRFPRRPRWVVTAAFCGVLLAMGAVPVIRSRDCLAVALGLEDRQSYLLRHEPTYRAAAVLNALAAPEDHLLSQDYRAFYFQGRVTRENVYRRYTHYDRRITEPVQLSRQLRDAGFTHLLLVETLTADGVPHDRTLSRLADAQLAAGSDELLTLTDYRHTDRDGTERRYRLVMLCDPAASPQ